MKKLFFALAMFCLSVSAFAQRGLEVGGFITPQSPWVFNQQDFDAGDELNFRFTMGYALGANAGFNFTKSIGLRSGIGISRQGQNYVNDFLDINSSLKMTYLKIPVLLKFNSDPSAKTSFLATLGIDLGILTGTKVTVDGTEVSPFPLDSWKEYYNGLDLSAVFGIGLQANISENLNINVLLRTSYSVMDIENSDYKDVGRESANHAIVGLQIGANYILFGDNE